MFTHHSGAAGAFHMPEIMGGGAALFDMDDDGDLDAYLVQGGELTAEAAEQPGNQLFANDGTGQFEDVTVLGRVRERRAVPGVPTGGWVGAPTARSSELRSPR